MCLYYYDGFAYCKYGNNHSMTNFKKISRISPPPPSIAFRQPNFQLEHPFASSWLEGEEDEGWCGLDPPYRNPSSNIFWRIKLSHLQSQPQCDREGDQPNGSWETGFVWRKFTTLIFSSIITCEGWGLRGGVKSCHHQSYLHMGRFSKHRPSGPMLWGPMLSISRNVHMFLCLCVCLSVCLSVHFWGTV